MDLRQLNTFLQVAELGSLGKAAGRLRIAQPALSRQIRLLEDELKIALFTRHGRGMVLTGAGEMLRARAGSILRQVDETRADLIHEAGAVRGRVVFGLPPTVGGVLATRLIERVLTAYPEVTLRVVQAFSGYLLEWLHGGEIDIAVVYGGPATAGIRLSPLLIERLHVVAASDGSGASSGPVPFDAVAERRLILPGPQHGLRRLIEDAARERGVSLNVAVEADDLQVLKDLALKGLGATVLPLGTVHGDVAAGRLHAAPITAPDLSRKLVIAQALARPVSNALRRFDAVLCEEVTEMVHSGIWDGQLLLDDAAHSPNRPRAGGMARDRGSA